MLQTLFKYGSADVSTCSCSRCGNRLPSTDINVRADAALCRRCGAAFRFSELLQGGGFPAFDLSHPPQGASFQAGPNGFVASAHTRSSQAWFLVPFMLVWSGFSLDGIYVSQFQKGRFDLGQSLLGIPFILGTILLGTQAIMYACGRVSVARNADEGSVFQGVGPCGWTRRFRWLDVESVVEGDASYGPRGGPAYRLIMLNFRSGRRLSLNFGTLLSDERRWFLISVLRSQIASRS
jgi:hypothetical protein